MEYMHVSAGEAAPILNEHTAGDTVNVSIQRLLDNLYWNGTDWDTIEFLFPSTEYQPGLYLYILPDILEGHYLISFMDSLGARNYTHLFAGGYKFTSTLELCLLYGIIVDGHNRPVRNVLIQLRPIPSAPVDNISVSSVPFEHFTDEFGNIAIELLRDREYLLDIPSINYSKRVLIPDASSVRLEDL